MISDFEGCMQSADEMEDATNSKVRYVDRRSTLGMYLRRIRMTFDKADLHQHTCWAKMLCEWRADESDGREDSQPFEHPHRPSDSGAEGMPRNDAPSALTRIQAFDRYQAALRRGDYSAAKENMFAFFDHTARGSTREMHQHALLNLAALHLEMESPSAAEPALHEAILLARSSRDWECVAACESLLRRVQALLLLEENDSNQKSGELASSAFETRTERDKDFEALYDESLKFALRGDYETALRLPLSTPLLAPSLSAREHTSWQTHIWQVLWLWARRRADAVVMRYVQAASHGIASRDRVHSWDHDLVSRTKGAGQAAKTFFVLRTARQLMLQYSQHTHARRLLEDILPEMLEEEDVEARGIAKMIYGQTLLAEDAARPSIKAALSWLQQALADFEQTQCLERQCATLYYLARVCELLGKEAESGLYAERLLDVEARIGSGAQQSEDQVRMHQLLEDITEVVGLLGANVALGIPT
ncbi:hypothetical protein OC845_006272 [Tilletia horrida]|nr:hypothetical protein OC845_006272 [Tilletia horrida]